MKVQIDLSTEGFRYQKWGSEQICKAGDWLVNNEGDTYTVDRDVFAATDEKRSPGLYEKVATIWAEQASEAGVVKTIEGETRHSAGAFIASHSPDGQDRWAIEAEKFKEMYELVP